MLTVLKANFSGYMLLKNSSEIFTTIAYRWKSLAIVIKSLILDIGRVFRSTPVENEIQV